MKIKAASGYACYVKDLNKTAEFYEKLGLTIKQRSAERLIVYLNWYRIDFFTDAKDLQTAFKQEAVVDSKGAGIFLYFSVDDVDQAYQEVIAAGLAPATVPADQRWGNREFTLVDPDGYKVVLFKRKVAKNPTD